MSRRPAAASVWIWATIATMAIAAVAARTKRSTIDGTDTR
jgi:hypothetical protein